MICFICRNRIDSSIPSIKLDEGLEVHGECLNSFKKLVRFSFEGDFYKFSDMANIVELVEGEPILVHRDFPSNIHPILVYLLIKNEPVDGRDIYSWLKKNQIKIKNPPQYVALGVKKGWIAPFLTTHGRLLKITQRGRDEINNFIKGVVPK